MPKERALKDMEDVKEKENILLILKIIMAE